MLKILINLLLIMLTIASLPHIRLTLNFAGAAPVNDTQVTSQITAINGIQHLLQLEMKKPYANETNAQQQQQQQQSSFNVNKQLNPSYVQKFEGENELKNKPQQQLQQQQQSSFNVNQQLNPSYVQKFEGENELKNKPQQQLQQQQQSSFNVNQQLNPSYVQKFDGENDLKNKPQQQLQQQQQSSFNVNQQLNPSYVKKFDGENELQNKPNNEEIENSQTTLQNTASPPLIKQLNEEVTREPIADTTPANYNKSLPESGNVLEKDLELEMDAVDASTYMYKNEMNSTENYSNLKYESSLELDNLSLTNDSYTFTPTDNELTTEGSDLNGETTTDNSVTDIMETTTQAEEEEEGPLILVLANFTALASLENDTEWDMEPMTTTTLTALDGNEEPTPLTTTEYPSNEAATTTMDDIWQNFQVTEHISKFFEDEDTTSHLANEQFQDYINETNYTTIPNIKPASNLESTNLPITTEMFEVSSTTTTTADPERVKGKYSNDSKLLETTPTTLLTITTDADESLREISDNVKNFQNLKINNNNNSISLSMTHNKTEETTTEIMPPTSILTTTTTATTTDIMTTDLSHTEYPTTTTTPTKRSRPPKLVHLRNPDGVEIFYGYSIVSLNQ